MTTQIILTSGSTWTVPSDWSSTNQVVCFGGGAGGVNTSGWDCGVGGGAYASSLNIVLTPGAVIQIAIGAGGAINANGGDTCFNGTSLASCTVGAQKGATGSGTTGGQGGQASSSVGTVRYSGGAGASSGRGGGGAGGPNGDGAAGSGSNGGAGGAGAGGAGGTTGGDGGNGSEFGAAGSGGGGGGGAGTGGAGGIYGGGGGSTSGGGDPAEGGSGAIVIEYTPNTLTTYMPGHGSIALSGKTPTLVNTPSSPTTYTPSHGAIVLVGKKPTYKAPTKYFPGAGSITLSGKLPALVTVNIFAPFAGSIELTGYTPAASGAGVLSPGVGSIVLTGQVPILATGPAVSTVPTGPTGALNTIPAFLYEEYNDDDNLQGIVAAQNAYTQAYVDYFNALNLPIYTAAPVAGPLLDWVATYLYDFPRPGLPNPGTPEIGPINTWTPNRIPINGLIPAMGGGFTATPDDIYRRCLTWLYYKGDGKQFNIPWLKRRIARFLYGANGTDPGIDETFTVSVVFTAYAAATITVPAGAISNVFAAAVAAGVLELPFQISFDVVVL